MLYFVIIQCTISTPHDYPDLSGHALNLNFLRNRLNRTFYEFIKIEVKKVPVIDLRQCTDCDSCLEICPAVFRRNKETGLIEVADLPLYPEDEVREAICICPNDCIVWEEE